MGTRAEQRRSGLLKIIFFEQHSNSIKKNDDMMR